MYTCCVYTCLYLIVIIVWLIACHSLCIHTTTIDFYLSHCKILPISMCTKYLDFEISHNFLYSSKLLLSSFIFSFSFNQLRPVIFLIFLIGQRNSTVNDKFIDYRRINFTTPNNYPLNADFFFQSYYDFERKFLICIQISVHIVL